MDKVGLVEGALLELTHEHQLSVTVRCIVDILLFISIYSSESVYFCQLYVAQS